MLSASLSASLSAPLGAATLEADLILSGGEVYTPAGWAEAVAIQDGVIIAVGDASAVEPYRAEHTEVVDVGGAAVFPGLHDMHVHPMGAGLMQSQCLFPQGSTPAAIEAAVAACADRHEDGEWIVGGQWDAASFGDVAVDRELLDRAAPANPVALMDIKIGRAHV